MKRRIGTSISWLVILLALAYYIIKPDGINRWFKGSFDENEGIATITKVKPTDPKSEDVEFNFTTIPSDQLFSYLYPSIDKGKQVVKHKAYTLEYNEQHEQADWVAYILNGDKLNGGFKRRDNFKSDRAVTTGSASLADYKRSGYDRGHLAPAADMNWSREVMDESFFMSNMSPQTAKFNRGIWKELEAQVRMWSARNNVLYVVTGPVLTGDEPKSIGDNGVTVPEYYYKVLLDFSEPELKSIAFILPNTVGNKDLKDYAVTIDRVEEKTGIDFFEKLPDGYEAELESKFSEKEWW